MLFRIAVKLFQSLVQKEIARVNREENCYGSSPQRIHTEYEDTLEAMYILCETIQHGSKTTHQRWIDTFEDVHQAIRSTERKYDV